MRLEMNCWTGPMAAQSSMLFCNDAECQALEKVSSLPRG